jgi:uncharacterized protein YndB with AHSA1/START domain
LNKAPREEAARIEVTIGAPVEVVWQAMREPDQIRRWHGWHAAELDEEIKLIYDTGAHETERPYALIIEPDDLFELEQVEGGTRIRVIRSAPEPGTEWASWFDDVTEGWTSFLNQLRFMLERHPREERRTVFFTGEGAAAQPSQLIADSPAAHGEQFFTAENQKGVLLDDLGPGLLIVAAKPSGNGAMAILTTYGQDQEAFDHTCTQWNSWWVNHYPDAPPPVT